MGKPRGSATERQSTAQAAMSGQVNGSATSQCFRLLDESLIQPSAACHSLLGTLK